MYLMTKWGLTNIISETGLLSKIENDQLIHEKIVEFSEHRKTNKKDRQLLDDVKLYLNSFRSGWNFITWIDKLEYKIMKKKIQPCTTFVYDASLEKTGGLNMQKDRIKLIDMERVELKKNFYQEQCSFAEQLWTLDKSQISDVKKEVFYVMLRMLKNYSKSKIYKY